MIQDFAFGGELSALGDLNGAGYDDFAASRTREALGASDGGLFVFLGEANYTGQMINPADADLMVRRLPLNELPPNTAFNGSLDATAGDFNADGKMDLAVSEPSRIESATGSGTVLGQDNRGSLHVFFSVMERGGVLTLSGADSSVSGALEFDAFGVLPETPGFDLDGDGIDDLVVGAPGADRFTDDLVPAAGKAYFLYGASLPPDLPAPDQIVDLLNTTITGSGDYLVDNGTGRAEVFQNLDIDGDGQTDFVRAPARASRLPFTTRRRAAGRHYRVRPAQSTASHPVGVPRRGDDPRRRDSRPPCQTASNRIVRHPRGCGWKAAPATPG